MQLVHPDTDRLRAARDRLLTAALREQACPWPIAAEYPLVLGAGGVDHSLCLVEHESVIAHVNVWPRRLLDSAGAADLPVALVGNVATADSHRGQGLMRRLLDLVKSAAADSGLAGLLLWSDLAEFYQKMGFKSCGAEARWLFAGRLPSRPDALPWRETMADRLTDPDLGRLMRLRPPVAATLARSAAEMRLQLGIPATRLMVAEVDGMIRGFAVVGRGADMAGVIHEWGVESPELLAGAVNLARELSGHQVVTLLAPGHLPAELTAALRPHADDLQTHPMAWFWLNESNAQLRDAALAVAERAFVWGLDSI